jgi:hypothetical protein
MGASFEVSAIKNKTTDKMYKIGFLVSIYFHKTINENEVNNKANNSSRPLILATTSVCMGCMAKSRMVKNEIH